MSGPTENSLRQLLEDRFEPSFLEITNESPKHGLPPEAEKHFRVVLVSAAFEGLGRIERHRNVNEIAAELLRRQIHALSIQAFTPSEWQAKNGETFASPNCLGGGKREGVGRK